MGEHVYFADAKEKDEAWLRDTLFDHPGIIPVEEIDSTFAPLVPLCKELRTEAGPIDVAFINERGRLTIVECKLWKNPQARREVVAQALHYVSAISGWSYADLQRQVATALGRQGNIPFELVQKHSGSKLREQEFVDDVSRSLREGRFLILLAGDGIREGVQSLTELWNRNPTKAFSFGLIEVAIYQFGKTRFALQSRVLAKTEIVTRQMTVVNLKNGTERVILEGTGDEPETDGGKVGSANKGHLRAWWQPVLDQMKLDDPEQEPPFWLVTNNVVLNTPFPGIQIKALAIRDSSDIGVFVSGPRKANVMMIQKYLKRERTTLLNELPKGTEIKTGHKWPIQIYKSDIESDDAKRIWIMKTMNTFANVLRPRLRKWYADAQRNR
jgi:hypothetical protein